MSTASVISAYESRLNLCESVEEFARAATTQSFYSSWDDNVSNQNQIEEENNLNSLGF